MNKGTRVMRKDGQYDTAESDAVETPATAETATSPALPATATVRLTEAQRDADVVLNVNGVWQEPWN